MPEATIPRCPRCGTQLKKHPEKDYWCCPNWLPANKGCEGTIWWPEGTRKSNYPNVIFSIKIESKSNPGHFHQVKIYETGDIDCPCTAGRMAKFCDHKRKAVKLAEDLLAKIKKENNHVINKPILAQSDPGPGGNSKEVRPGGEDAEPKQDPHQARLAT